MGFEKDVLRAVANLALIEDGHPCHTKVTGFGADAEETSKYEYVRQELAHVQDYLVSLADTDQEKEDAKVASASLGRVVSLLETYSYDLAMRFAVLHYCLHHLTEKKEGRQPKAKPDPILAKMVDDNDKYINDTTVGTDDWETRAKRAWTLLAYWHSLIDKSNPKSDYYNYINESIKML